LQAFSAADWRPPVLKTVASDGTGIDQLWNAIERFRARPDQSRAARQRRRVEVRLRQLMTTAYLRHVERVVPREEIERIIDRMVARELDPYAAAESVLRATVAAEAPDNAPARADAPAPGTARS
jgi:LAO/AO transport system kinase